MRDDLFYVNIIAKQGVEAQLDFLLCTKVSNYVDYSFFFSNIKFAECTRRVYHLGYSIFFRGWGEGLCQEMTCKTKIVWIWSEIKLEAILELTWKNQLAVFKKKMEIYD